MHGQRPWYDVPLVRLLPAAWCMATIWWLSDQSRLNYPPGGVEFWSVVGHFCAFGMLGLSIWFALGMNSRMLDRERVIYAIVITGLYGVLDEIHQHFTPGRYPDVLDVIVDVLGATTFVLVVPRIYDRLTR